MDYFKFNELLEWKMSDIEEYLLKGWGVSSEEKKESTVIKFKKGDTVNLKNCTKEKSEEIDGFNDLIGKMFKHKM